MRSAEVRHLKDERSKLLEQLEAFENTRNLLEKMNARVEDLQAQLEAKSQVERYSGGSNTERVWILDGQKLFKCWMVLFSNAILNRIFCLVFEW